LRKWIDNLRLEGAKSKRETKTLASSLFHFLKSIVLVSCSLFFALSERKVSLVLFMFYYNLGTDAAAV
jgi:hypothetical protein